MRRIFNPTAAIAIVLAALTWPGSVHGQVAPKKAETVPPPEKNAATLPGAKTTGDSALSEEKDVLVLSPFEVRAGDENGYAAATSLAGNRLNTELRDVGSAISVVTEQMLKDIGATSSETLLQYTTNTEVGNIYGNMANVGNNNLPDEGGKFTNPNQNTRVRGLASADTTVNYFLTDIPWDSYNVDRVDFQRGPNAILFGLGSPAGIINAGTKSAGYQNKGSVEFKYSRFGSMRTTLGVNHVLIDKQLAFRIDVLNDDQKFQQKPTYQTDRRFYAAVRFEPKLLNRGSVHTTLKANFEKGKVRSNRPRSLTPGDAITPWFLTGTGNGYLDNGTPFTYNNLNKKGFDARGLGASGTADLAGLPTQGEFTKFVGGQSASGLASGTLNPYWQPWLGGQFGSTTRVNPLAVFNSGDSSALNNLMKFSGASTVRGIGTNGAIDGSINGVLSGQASSITLYRDFSNKVKLPGGPIGLTRAFTLTDPTIFDFYNQLLDGPNKNEWQNFHRFNVNLSQTFFDGAIGFEGAYDKQHYDNGTMALMTARGTQIYVDVIKTLFDGTTNPNFGRAFITDDGAGGNQSFSDREAARLTAFARYDFQKGRRTSFLTRLLGKHTVTGLYADDKKENSFRQFVHYVADNGYKDFVAGSNPSSIGADTRKVTQAIYLGQSLVNATSASGAYIPNPTVASLVTSGSIRAFDSTWIATTVDPAALWENTLFPVGNPKRTSTQSENPANYRGWVNTPITITNSEDGYRDQNTNFRNRSKNRVTSKAINWQGYFWDRAFVAMYGYRSDTSKNWVAAVPAGTNDSDAEGRPVMDPQIFKYPATPSLVSDNSRSWSAVLHLNTLLKQKLPLNVSFFYNKSSNFQPIAGRVNLLKQSLPPPRGETKDIGILLATKDDKYSVKVNVYESASKNTSNGDVNNQIFMLGQVFQEGQSARDRFFFQVANPNDPTTYLQGSPSQWTYQPALNQTEAQAAAAQTKDVADWDKFVKSMPNEYVEAFNLRYRGVNNVSGKFINQSIGLSDITNGPIYTTPSGLTVTNDTVSKGVEIELFAQPIKGLRLTANVSKSEAVRSNVGDATFNAIVNQINTALNTTGAGTLRQNSSGSATTILERWNFNFWGPWVGAKGLENVAVPESRKWRANLIANYDFTSGLLKGVNVGIGVRWQDKVLITYAPIYLQGLKEVTTPSEIALANRFLYDTTKPYYGPAETDVDLWLGYSHRINKKLNWRTQLNVRSVGKTNSLIPVTFQPWGEVATWRIAPTQVWSLTNTLEF